jgi:hypothetical protein
VDVTTWRLADEGDFALRLPDQLRPEEVRGIDSQVGRWSGGGLAVHYDYGAYSNRLDGAGAWLAEFVESTGAIGGRPARIIQGWDAGDDGKGKAARIRVDAAWRDVRRGAHLTLSTSGERREDATLLRAIVCSVTFEGA